MAYFRVVMKLGINNIELTGNLIYDRLKYCNPYLSVENICSG